MTDATNNETPNGGIPTAPTFITSRDDGHGADEHRAALVNAALDGALVAVLFERPNRATGAASGRVGLIDAARNLVIIIANASTHATVRLDEITHVRRLRKGKDA